MRKLKFLGKITALENSEFLGKITALENSDTLSAQTLHSLSDDISSICLVRELEQYFGTDFASALLTQDAGPRPCPREVKEVIEKDRSLMLTKHAGRADMAIVAKIESEVGWPRLWDFVDGLKNLVRVIAFPSHATSVCPVCDSVSVQRDHLLAHVITLHVDANFTSDELLQELSSVSDSYLTTCVTLLILVLLYPTGSHDNTLTTSDYMTVAR